MKKILIISIIIILSLILLGIIIYKDLLITLFVEQEKERRKHGNKIR